MPKNSSNKEKTIKSSMRLMNSDFWTIDNFSLYMNYSGLAQLPDGFILDDFRDYFDQFLEEIDLNEEYYYSPSLFAHHYYGTADLDFLVLYFAKIPTMFEFNQPRIKVLPITALTDLNKLAVEYKQIVKSSKANPKEYLPFDELSESIKGYIEEYQSISGNYGFFIKNKGKESVNITFKDGSISGEIKK